MGRVASSYSAVAVAVTCVRCNRDREPGEFFPSRPTTCKVCLTDGIDPTAKVAATRLWRLRNPEKQLAITLRAHGLTVERWTELLEEQDHVCALCREPETEQRNGTVKRLAVDHDHACCPGRKSCGKCVRGLLCHRCNRIIGQIRNTATLTRALEYLAGAPC